MKKFFTRTTMLIAACFLAGSSYAQLTLPEGSQRATVTQRVGITEISINYGRPKVNDREIWGKLVPYGFNNLGFGTSTAAPWRAGANDNTTISFSHDVKIEGKDIKAGKYGLHMAVEESGDVTVIFSNDTGAWGSYFYKEENDALRVNVKSKEAYHAELLTFEFPEVEETSTIASLRWAKKAIPFKIEVPVKEIVMAKINSELTNTPGFTQSSWDQAAGFAMQNGDLDKALEWVNGSIEGNFFSKPTYANLSMKAQVLTTQGKTSEAEKLTDKIIEAGSANELFQYAAQYTAAGKHAAAINIHKANVKKNAGAWPSNYGLARGYAANGDYKKAIKSLSSAQKSAPDRFKDRLVGDMAKLKKGENIN